VDGFEPSMMNNRGTAGSRPRAMRLSISACTTAAFSVAPVYERLRPQVQRLRESLGGEPAVGPAARNSAQQQVDAGPPPAEACARDTMRLQRLRADPNPEEIRKFERDLSYEQIRPQVQRLCDSVCR
jgi:hypothetical protein